MVPEGLDGPLHTPSILLVPGLAYISLLSRIDVISNKRLASTNAKTIPDAFRGLLRALSLSLIISSIVFISSVKRGKASRDKGRLLHSRGS